MFWDFIRGFCPSGNLQVTWLVGFAGIEGDKIGRILSLRVVFCPMRFWVPPGGFWVSVEPRRHGENFTAEDAEQRRGKFSRMP